MRSPYPARVLVGLVAGVLLLGASTLQLSCRLVYNPTASVPFGWYVIDARVALRTHDMVLARLPGDVAALADERRYLPAGVPILKEIGAVEGQMACVMDGVVSIDGQRVAHARKRDAAGRPLASWSGCRTLVADELFLLSRGSEASFDSRYFGPIAHDAVIGKATPVWTW